MARSKLVLKGFSPLKGDTARRAKNDKTGEIISRREFVKRAERVELKQKPIKKRETRKEQRARWYANNSNKQTWEEYIRNPNSPQPEYISFAEAMASPEFQYFEGLIRSPYEEDRKLGYNYFEELEDEFLTQDWGETP